MRIEVRNAEAVAKEALWLAWQACGSPAGMGWLQNRPDATREDVWANAVSSGDYPLRLADGTPNRVYADYVFGRMMKLPLELGEGFVAVPDSEPRADYQSWCRKYPTYAALVAAADAAVNGTTEAA